jgi:hypothetical protein
MKSSALSFAGALATAALLLHGAAALTACGGGSGGSAGGTTTATGGATTTSTTTTHATGGATTTSSTATGGTGTGGSASDAGSDGGSNLCTQTGGTVGEISCSCTSQGDFPSTCAIGGCTCAPGQSHMIKTCNCPGSECYDPTNGCMTQI